MAVLLFLGIMSFDANDPSFNLVKSGKHEIKNMAGLFGAYAAGFLNDIFGICALLWPFVFGFLGGAYLSAKYTLHWWRWCGLFLLTICMLILSSSLDLNIGDLAGGGMVGNTLWHNGARYLSPVGTFLVWLFLLLTGLQMFLNFSWISLFARISQCLARKTNSASLKNIFTSINARLARFKIKPPALPKVTDIKKILSWRPNFKKTTHEDMPAQNIVSSQSVPPTNAYASASEAVDDDPFASVQNMAWNRPEESANPLETVRVINSESISPADQTGENQQSEANLQLDANAVASPLLPDETEDEFALDEEQENFVQSGNQASSQSLKLFNNEPDPVFPMPPTSLLKPALPFAPATMENLQSKGRDLMTCFRDFSIDGELVKITPGPVITRYEVRPAAGVRVSRIVNLSDDLSLALKAMSVRIQPVLGSNTVGIEIPNESREMVNFRELVESDDFQEGCGPLTVVLGKTTSGKPYMADLTKMPHLLVGGTTGAGKSVSLNAMIISLLYRLQPSELKMLLIDPKRVEMAVYADMPHLVHPVVTEMEDAKTALEWAIHEMQNRFDAIKRLGVRNVASYNQRLAKYKDGLPPDFGDLKPIPYLVIVIDELADLMMTAGREVEGKINRLLALARAAAIHLILATQRPSVDVVTGLLKANLNCRMAFRVISKHDSRTILDEMGAEHLLGKGDMLYKPPAGALIRLHAPYLGDDEIQAVVNYWKSKQAPAYDIDFSRWNPGTDPSDTSSHDNANRDELYDEAKAFLMEQGRASISLLQRRLKIGFNRAASLMEQFEKDGIITPADGSKPRTVIRN